MTNTNGLTASDGNEDFQAALAAHRKGNLSAAAKVYAKVLEHNPAHAGANNNMGALLRDLGDEEEAVIYFTRALEVRPDLLETRYSLGVILMNLGDYKGARMHFRTVAKSAPSDSRALVGLAALDLRSGDSISALKEAKEACRRNAMDANAWSIIGVSNKELGHFTEAHLAYNRALDLDPNHAEAHYNRGALRLLVGDMPNGWEDYAWRWKGEGRQAPGSRSWAPHVGWT